VRAAVDERLELIFVHYPIPHIPFIFDRATGSIRVDGPSTYADNLALTDRTLKELRQALEDSGLWDRTALIVTSDHWFRRSGWRERGDVAPVVGRPDHRVPLIVRLPGQRMPVVRRELLQSAAAYELAAAILAGALETSAQLDAVMDSLPPWMRLINDPGRLDREVK
jgi:arylsulfatase A-like enzyme